MILLRSFDLFSSPPARPASGPLTEPGLIVLRTAPELRKTWCRVPEREGQDRGVRFPFVKHTVPFTDRDDQKMHTRRLRGERDARDTY